MWLLQVQSTSPHGIQDVFDILKTLTDHASGMTNTLLVIAKAIGYIAIMFIWGIDIAKSTSMGTPINFTKYLYPIILAIVIGSYGVLGGFLSRVGENSFNDATVAANYNYLLLDDEARFRAMAKDALTEAEKNKASVWKSDVASNSTDPNVQKAADYELMADAVNTIQASNSSMFSGLADKFNPTVWMNTFFKWIACILGQVAYYALALIVRFRLAMLAIIGPIAIAISIIPAYQSSAANFVHKAVSYILWLPLAALVNGAIQEAFNRLLNTNESSTALILCLVLFQILMYLQIPKIAHEIMMVGGGRQGSGVGQAVTNKVVSAVV